jgi:two-component system sensor histidine kinase DevS
VSRGSTDTDGRSPADYTPSPPRAPALGDAWVIVELAPDAVLVVDERGHIELANRAAEIMFGYDRAALALLGVDALVADGRRDVHRGHRAAFDASPKTRPMGAELDLWAQRADGTAFPVEVSLSPVTFGHGPRTLAIVRDVTTHRAREQAFRDRLVLADKGDMGPERRNGVINRLFAVGLAMHVLSKQLPPELAQDLLDLTDDLDQAIREIRNSAFSPERLAALLTDKPG